MGSKSYSSVSTNEQLDNSQVQGVNALRGDGNTFQVLDGEAIKNAFAFGMQNSEGQAKNVGDMLKTFGTVADKTLKNAFESGQAALGFADKANKRAFDFGGDSLNFAKNESDKSFDFSKDMFKSFVSGTNDVTKRLAEVGNSANSAIMSAYGRAQNNGLDPQMLVMGALGLGVLFIIFKK